MPGIVFAECPSVSLKLLSLHLSLSATLAWHGQVAVLSGSSYLTNCSGVGSMGALGAGAPINCSYNQLVPFYSGVETTGAPGAGAPL